MSRASKIEKARKALREAWDSRDEGPVFVDLLDDLDAALALPPDAPTERERAIAFAAIRTPHPWADAPCEEQEAWADEVIASVGPRDSRADFFALAARAGDPGPGFLAIGGLRLETSADVERRAYERAAQVCDERAEEFAQTIATQRGTEEWIFAQQCAEQACTGDAHRIRALSTQAPPTAEPVDCNVWAARFGELMVQRMGMYRFAPLDVINGAFTAPAGPPPTAGSAAPSEVEAIAAELRERAAYEERQIGDGSAAWKFAGTHAAGVLRSIASGIAARAGKDGATRAPPSPASKPSTTRNCSRWRRLCA